MEHGRGVRLDRDPILRAQVLEPQRGHDRDHRRRRSLVTSHLHAGGRLARTLLASWMIRGRQPETRPGSPPGPSALSRDTQSWPQGHFRPNRRPAGRRSRHARPGARHAFFPGFIKFLGIKCPLYLAVQFERAWTPLKREAPALLPAETALAADRAPEPHRKLVQSPAARLCSVQIFGVAGVDKERGMKIAVAGVTPAASRQAQLPLSDPRPFARPPRTACRAGTAMSSETFPHALRRPRGTRPLATATQPRSRRHPQAPTASTSQAPAPRGPPRGCSRFRQAGRPPRRSPGMRRRRAARPGRSVLEAADCDALDELDRSGHHARGENRLDRCAPIRCLLVAGDHRNSALGCGYQTQPRGGDDPRASPLNRSEGS